MITLNSTHAQGTFSSPIHLSNPGKSGKSCILLFLRWLFKVERSKIALEDQEKTIFTCSFGIFAYWHMPIGFCNAPSTFQICMMGIFSYLLEKVVEVFMDDFLVFGDSFESCLFHLELIWKRYEEKGLVLNWKKCHLMVS